MKDSNLASGGLCSVKEACAFLSLGKTSVYNLMAEGKLPFVFLGGVRRIPRVALIEFTEKALEVGRVDLAN
ncbi:MAG: helix-turn-helix domain-containing protein [Limnochordia bacterium]|jgi:excisionase family DNA binding protein